MILKVHAHNIEKKETPINELELNITKVKFEFDEELIGTKKAYFTLDDGTTYMEYILNNECDIPNEVLAHKGQVEIGVTIEQIENEETIKRYNPSPIYIATLIGSLRDYENSEEITPTDKEQMEQMLDNINIQGTKVDNVATISITNKDGLTHEVELYDGEKGDKGDKGDKGEQGPQGEQGIQGIQGVPGPQGEAFTIKKTYSSVAEMNADFDNMQVGDYVMIASSVEIQDNAKLYTRGVEEWIFITDFSGATGIQGEQGPQGEQGIQGPQGIQGIQGETGATGNGIASITKTATSGLVDTYTITYTNGNTTTYDVSNGKGIVSITKTGSVSNIDTYTILFNDGTTTTYEVANGEVTQASFDELKEETDLILDQIPKGTASGESININDSSNLPLKDITLKGNTSQVTIPNNNLVDFINNTGVYGGTYDRTTQMFTTNAISVGYDGINMYNTNTPLTIPVGTSIFYYSAYVRLKSGTYSSNLNVFRKGNNITDVSQSQEALSNPNITSTFQRYIFKVTYTNSGANDETSSNHFIQLKTGADNCVLEIKDVMISKTNDEYSPYVGNSPSPNPKYPQDIHSVSGDNEIEVCGKNLFDKNSPYIVNGYLNANGSITTNASYRVSNYMYIGNFSKITIAGNIENALVYCFYDENKNLLGANGITGSSKTITPPTNTKYIRTTISASGLDSYMVVEGETAPSEYIPYTGNTYPIYLGVENLWKNQLSGFLPQTGAYPTTNDSYPNARYILVELKEGQSITLSGSTSNHGRARYIDKDTNQCVGSITTAINNYYTSTDNVNNGFNNPTTITAKKDFIVGIMDLFNDVNDLVVNYGTKPQHISTQPIEMGDINERKDTFVRTSGENIFNVIDYTNLVLSNNSSPSNVVKTTDKITFTANGNWSGINLTKFINSYVDNGDTNTTYYVSLDVKVNANTTCQIGNVTKEDVSLTSGTQRIFVATQFTSSTSFVIYNRTSDTINYEITNIMVSKQNNTNYIPYGSGEWYWYREIGEKVLNSSSITNSTTYTNIDYAIISKPSDFLGYNSFDQTEILCESATYLGGTPSWNTTANIGKISGNASKFNWWLGYEKNGDFDTLKNQLNGKHIYYPLATPTYTKILDSALINQLEAIYKARTKKNVTNISQVNNDEAFTIDIVYYKDLETLFNSLGE